MELRSQFCFPGELPGHGRMLARPLALHLWEALILLWLPTDLLALRQSYEPMNISFQGLL